MNEEQQLNTASEQPRQTQVYYSKEQYRHERRMAKQAAREARRDARAHRPRHAWVFEVKVGDKVYTFSWKWLREVLLPEAAPETSSAGMPVESPQETPEAGQ